MGTFVATVCPKQNRVSGRQNDTIFNGASLQEICF